VMNSHFPLFPWALFSDPELGRKLNREHIAPVIRQRGQILDGLTRDALDLEFVGLAIFGILFGIALDRHFGGEDAVLGQADLPELAKQFTRMSTGGFARDRTAADKPEN